MSTTPMSAELETLRGTYAALNRGGPEGVAAMVAAMDPDIEWIEPPQYPGSKTCRGRAELEAHIIEARGRWAEGGCVPRRYVIAGDRIVVFLDIRVRMKGASDWIVGDTTDVYTFRGGKAVQMRTFPTWDEAVMYAKAGEAAAREWPE